MLISPTAPRSVRPTAVPPHDPASYCAWSTGYCDIDGAWKSDQHNPGGTGKPLCITGPGTWADTEGKVTILLVSGTGGTITGAGRTKECPGAEYDRRRRPGGTVAVPGRPYSVEAGDSAGGL